MRRPTRYFKCNFFSVELILSAMKHVILTSRLMLLLAVIVQAQPTNAANHLAGSKSEYLQRAVNQPVDWRPWGAEAFALAEKLNRPVLLDVGATWCAFCATMDKESYNDPEVAAC